MGNTTPKRMSQVEWDILLSRVEKPSRYLGGEINAVHKDPGDVVLRAGLVFPDLYEVGMAHLGTQILYGLGNDLPGVQVERVFLPGEDLLALLREHHLPLFTLESRTPLVHCHILGFTLQSELTYTNILTILQAAGIPIYAGERSEDHPVVLGGGPCAFNPEPLAPFFDLFYLGDGEVQWPEMLGILREKVLGGDGMKTALDVGCGPGFMMEIIGELTGVRGVDVDEDMVKACRARGLDVERASAYDLPFGDGSFDIVYCTFLMLWLEDPESALAEISRVSRNWSMCSSTSGFSSMSLSAISLSPSKLPSINSERIRSASSPEAIPCISRNLFADRDETAREPERRAVAFSSLLAWE